MATPCRDDQLICLKKDLTEAIDTLPKSIAGKSTEKLENVESTLERWISNIRGKPGQGDYWVYHLEDSSKRKDLSDGLAADDLARLRYLQGLESKHQFNVFGAQVQKKVIGTRRAAIDHRAEECPGSEAEDEDEDEDEADAEPDTGEDNVCEINWTIQVTFGINGGRKTNILDLNPDNILQDDCFKGYKPDEDNVSDDDYDEPAHPDECTYIQYYRSLVSFGYSLIAWISDG
ncbi:hypothetical protein F5B20DRAFT_454645 [Whalleya microplaca]|nr:hypothetical protein F5B20DRAFT_454645 [Whalleya microplaca]